MINSSATLKKQVAISSHPHTLGVGNSSISIDESDKNLLQHLSEAIINGEDDFISAYLGEFKNKDWALNNISNGERPLDLAFKHGKKEIIKLIIKDTTNLNLDVINWKTIKDNTDIVIQSILEEIQRRKLPFEERSRIYKAAINITTRLDKRDLLEEIVSQRLSVDTSEDKYQNAFFISQQYGLSDTLIESLRNGANPRIDQVQKTNTYRILTILFLRKNKLESLDLKEKRNIAKNLHLIFENTTPKQWLDIKFDQKTRRPILPVSININSFENPEKETVNFTVYIYKHPITKTTSLWVRLRTAADIENTTPITMIPIAYKTHSFFRSTKVRFLTISSPFEPKQPDPSLFSGHKTGAQLPLDLHTLFVMEKRNEIFLAQNERAPKDWTLMYKEQCIPSSRVSAYKKLNALCSDKKTFVPLKDVAVILNSEG